MTQTLKIVLITFVIGTIFSCSAEKRLKSKIVGDWTIQEYSQAVGEENEISMKNVGSYHFDKSGEGERKLDYKILKSATKEDKIFNWSNDENSVRISDDSGKAETWVVVDAKSKKQKWVSTDDAGEKQVMVLKRIPHPSK
ncbi:MAG: hypothetical protein LAT68_14595 [Cyclobacteriaceae bacterium]|nr:hypothetical protein [Cyclobacteriaceae bacterium]MCH8517549.1 hypothetical protein [Cyclobacteriaceae bacterium]